MRQRTAGPSPLYCDAYKSTASVRDLGPRSWVLGLPLLLPGNFCRVLPKRALTASRSHSVDSGQAFLLDCGAAWRARARAAVRAERLSCAGDSLAPGWHRLGPATRVRSPVLAGHRSGAVPLLSTTQWNGLRGVRAARSRRRFRRLARRMGYPAVRAGSPNASFGA